MIIRAIQIQLLSAAAATNFKARLVEHISKCFPQQYAALGPSLAGLLINLGVESAERNGFHGKRDVCGFIDLMVIFGPDFDTDRRLPWVRSTLEDTRLPSTLKMRRLLATAENVLARMANTDRGA